MEYTVPCLEGSGRQVRGPVASVYYTHTCWEIQGRIPPVPGPRQAVYASLYAPWRILGISDLPVARAGQGPLRGGTRSG